MAFFLAIFRNYTASKVSKYGVSSGPYFPVLGRYGFCCTRTVFYGVNLRIQSEYRKIRNRKNSVFGHFSHSDQAHYGPS